MLSNTPDSLILTLAVCQMLHQALFNCLSCLLTPVNRQTGMNYEMSRLIPPQFDTYGVTFWIPSQVEPTVALIGASMPALRHVFTTVVPQLSRIWTSLTSGSTQHTEQYGSLKGKSYQNLRTPHTNQTPYDTGDTAQIRHSQPLEHPPRPYIQLEEWRR